MPRGPLKYRRSQKSCLGCGSAPAKGTAVTEPLSLGLVGFWALTSTICGRSEPARGATGSWAPAGTSVNGRGDREVGAGGEEVGEVKMVRNDVSRPTGPELLTPTFTLVTCALEPRAPITTTTIPPTTHATAMTANAAPRLAISNGALLVAAQQDDRGECGGDEQAYEGEPGNGDPSHRPQQPEEQGREEPGDARGGAHHREAGRAGVFVRPRAGKGREDAVAGGVPGPERDQAPGQADDRQRSHQKREVHRHQHQVTADEDRHLADAVGQPAYRYRQKHVDERGADEQQGKDADLEIELALQTEVEQGVADGREVQQGPGDHQPAIGPGS